MLLLPFVENVFKHGNFAKGAGLTKIKLSVAENKIIFETSNPYKVHVKDKVKGIGIENVRKRLQHIYANRFSLEIKDEQSWYHLKLEING